MKVLTLRVLTLRYPYNHVFEVHLLNPGDMFPDDFDPEKYNGFGGSRHPLITGRDFATGEKQKTQTASLVVRHTSPMGLHDNERDIHDPGFWLWMAKLINGEIDEKVTAEGPAGKEDG